MKKIVFLIISSIFLICFVPCRAVQDSVAPVLQSVSFNKTTVKNPDYISVTIFASDNASGISSISITVNRENGGTASFGLEHGYVPKGNAYQIKLYASKGMAAGKWYLQDIQLCDYANNVSVYTYAGSNDPYSQSYGMKKTFEVQDSPNLDTEPPVVKDISVSTKNAVYPSNVTVRAEITDKSTIDDATICYQYDNNVEHSMLVSLKRESSTSTWYRGDLKISTNSNRYAKYTFSYLYIRDKCMNEVYYRYADSQDVKNGYSKPLTKNVDITVTNVRTNYDTTSPELVSITVNKSQVTAPAVLSFTITAKDAGGSGLKTAEVVAVHTAKNGKTTSLQYPGLSQKAFNGNKVTVDFEAPSYVGEGTIAIVSVILRDGDGNETQYGTNARQKPISSFAEKAKVLVSASSGKQDIVTGTKNTNMLRTIEYSPKSAVIRVDCQQDMVFPKEGFDLIKGTDRVLILEAEGIRWTFFGKQMNQTTKDICINISACLASDNDTVEGHTVQQMAGNSPCLMLMFVSNGVLPGPATVQIKSEYTFRNIVGVKDLFAYYYNSQNAEMETIAQKVGVNPEGYYELQITHNSTYVLSNKQIDSEYVAQSCGGKSTGKGKLIQKQVAEQMGTASTANATVSSSQVKKTNVSQEKETKEPSKNSGTGWWVFILIISIVGACVVCIVIFKKPLKRNV